MYYVMGKENINYISKRTQKPVIGVKIYVTYPLRGERGVGDGCDTFFVSSSLVSDVLVGDQIEILFNKYGTVADIKKL